MSVCLNHLRRTGRRVGAFVVVGGLENENDDRRHNDEMSLFSTREKKTRRQYYCWRFFRTIFLENRLCLHHHKCTFRSNKPKTKLVKIPRALFWNANIFSRKIFHSNIPHWTEIETDGSHGTSRKNNWLCLFVCGAFLDLCLVQRNLGISNSFSCITHKFSFSNGFFIRMKRQVYVIIESILRFYQLVLLPGASRGMAVLGAWRIAQGSTEN